MTDTAVRNSGEPSEGESAGPQKGGLAAWRVRRIEALAAEDLRGLTHVTLARSVGLSPYHFNRAFAASMGVTPGRWLFGLRHQRARVLLEATDLPVAEIARRVGYRGSAQLTRAFRTVTGLTPTGYRRR